MKCKCGKTSTVSPSYVKRVYCDRCFLRYIEHRVRKDVRLHKDINPLDTIYLFNDDSKEFFVAKHFLSKVFGKNLTVKETKNKKIKGKLVIPTNLEREVSENLQEFLQNTNKENKLLILDNVLEEEVIEICRILGIKAKKTEKTNFIVEKMEEKYPGTKFSLHKSFQQLKQL